MDNFKKKIIDIIKNDKGAIMTVEASFVFPILFFVLFFLIYFGNAYYVKSNVDYVVSRYAIQGAAECADPNLKAVIEGKSVPNNVKARNYPYRYLTSGYGSGVASRMSSKIKTDIKNTGFFKNMQPTNVKCNVKYNNKFIYQSLKVDVVYEIKFPIRFIFFNEATVLKMCSSAETPVCDSAELVLNTNMVIDFIEHTGLDEKFNEIVGKLKGAVSKFFN